MNMARIIIAKIVIVIFLAIVVFCSDVPRAIAGNYLGEFCWQFQDVGHSGNSWVVKYGVFDNGGGHYYLSGVTNINGEIVSGHGNGESNGNTIYGTINVSGIHSWGKAAKTINMTLDSSLNGSYFSLEHEYGKCGGSGTDTHCLAYYHGTVTFVSCP